MSKAWGFEELLRWEKHKDKKARKREREADAAHAAKIEKVMEVATNLLPGLMALVAGRSTFPIAGDVAQVPLPPTPIAISNDELGTLLLNLPSSFRARMESVLHWAIHSGVISLTGDSPKTDAPAPIPLHAVPNAPASSA